MIRFSVPEPGDSAGLGALLDRIDGLKIHFMRNRNGHMVADFHIEGMFGHICPDEETVDHGGITDAEFGLLLKLIHKARQPTAVED